MSDLAGRLNRLCESCNNVHYTLLQNTKIYVDKGEVLIVRHVYILEGILLVV